MMHPLQERFEISLGRLIEFERKEKELEQSKKLVKRLRAERNYYREELQSVKSIVLEVKEEFKRQKAYPFMLGAYRCANRLGFID